MKKTILFVATLLLALVFAWWASKFLTRSDIPKQRELILQAPPPFKPKLEASQNPQAARSQAASPTKPTTVQATNQQPAVNKQPSKTLDTMQTLEEIFNSKNDNDPRLDSDFNDLSAQTKNLMRQKYREIPPERRNERGTIVFLLGRNLSSAQDWAFLRGVVSEPPCLSLEDCSKEIPSQEDAHESGIEVTLAYPQIVSLKMAQRALSSSASQEAIGVIEAAKNSKVAIVARMAAPYK